METTTNLASWQGAWREGIVPQLTTVGLRNLKAALERNDPQMVTGATSVPPPLQSILGCPVQACCPFCFALLDGLEPYQITVGQLEERFALACSRADELLGEPAGIRHFLNQIDEWTRQDLIWNLLPEVHRALAQRHNRLAAVS